MINLTIFGLISFIIQIYVLKHTYTQTNIGYFKFDWEKAEKLGIPVWVFLSMFIGSVIPVVNIAETIIFWITWLIQYADINDPYSWKSYTYWRFKDKFFSRKI